MNRYAILAAIASLPLCAAVPAANAADLDDVSYLRSDSRVTRDYNYEARRGDWREHRPYRGFVEARGSAATERAPYHIVEWRARRAAIDAWKRKVDALFGPNFAHWREASDKRLECGRVGRGGVECSASARPERSEGGGRWGSWNWRRTYY